MLPRFEYWQSDEDFNWYFHLRSPKGGIIFQSAGYESEDECLEGIELVRRYAEVAVVVYDQQSVEVR